MKATEVTRPQDISSKMVTRTTLNLSIAVSILGTALIVTVANWFMFSNIHESARANVYSDIQVSKGLK